MDTAFDFIRELSFANCVLDVRARKLFVDGRPRKLDTLAFDLLVQLLMNDGRIVSRQELVDAVWPGRDVAPEVLSRAIMKLRRSISIDAPGDLIWTIQGRGYRIASGVQVTVTMDPDFVVDASGSDPDGPSGLPRRLDQLSLHAKKRLVLARTRP